MIELLKTLAELNHPDYGRHGGRKLIFPPHNQTWDDAYAYRPELNMHVLLIHHTHDSRDSCKSSYIEELEVIP
jgi:hypothetical protein